MEWCSTVPSDLSPGEAPNQVRKRARTFSDRVGPAFDRRRQMGSTVDLAAVPDLEHQDHQLTVLDVADHPVVAHAVAP